jgi:hypothetical protein
MTQAAQIIHRLGPIRFRGVTWEHFENAPVSFSHSQAERRYPFIDGAGHDWTGMDPLQVSVRMLFLETLKPGAFTFHWPKWRKALFDGTAADFQHPVLGTFKARVLGGDIQFAAQTTAGIIVDVRFTSTVENIDKPNQFKDPQPSGIQVASAAQASANAVGIPWPSQKLDRSLEDAFKALQTGFWDAQVTYSGYANQLVGDIESMITAAEDLTDPTAYPAYDNLVHIWELTRDAADKAQKDLRARGSRIVQSDTTIATFAAEVGNTESEVAQHNYALLRSPIIPSGTAVHYYTGK